MVTPDHIVIIKYAALNVVEIMTLHLALKEKKNLPNVPTAGTTTRQIIEVALSTNNYNFAAPPSLLILHSVNKASLQPHFPRQPNFLLYLQEPHRTLLLAVLNLKIQIILCIILTSLTLTHFSFHGIHSPIRTH